MSDKLNIWILQTGEPIHLDDDMPRPMRGMNLSNKLVELGHNINFISSVFYHQKKVHRSKANRINKINSQLKITLIDSPGYKKNISFSRFYDHMIMAYNLKMFLDQTVETPDVVFIGYPPIEISYVMSKWLKKRKIPFILDIKDQWPDLILGAFPSFIKFFGKLILFPYYYMAKQTINNANAITSMSKSFIDWSKNYKNKNIDSISMILPLVPSENILQENEVISTKKWCDNMGIINRDGQVNIFFVGSLSKAFDFQTIIKCAKKLELINKNIKFIICGDGEFKELLVRQAKSQSNIVLPGWVDINKIKIIASRSLFAIAPYKNIKNFKDNIPNKIIDYLSLGLPIISPLQGEVSNLISKNNIGMSYIENSENSLSDIIVSLSKNIDLINRLSNNALKLYNENYSFNHVYGKAEMLIKEIYLLNKKISNQ
ncbi:glycosyltransferase [Pelagibacteraceae bacterium]|nr:glycosyltransferase [Pelagibacteraceae bacterium]